MKRVLSHAAAAAAAIAAASIACSIMCLCYPLLDVVDSLCTYYVMWRRKNVLSYSSSMHMYAQQLSRKKENMLQHGLICPATAAAAAATAAAHCSAADYC
jgi:hypothetical protein